jgi:hypothetical protein
MLFALYFLIASAMAGTYYSELPIPAAAPTDDAVTAISVIRVADVAGTEPDQDHASDWAWVRCGVKSGGVYAVFSGTKANWPTTIPATATCTENGETWVLDLVPTTNPTTVTVAGSLVTFDLGPDTYGAMGIELRPDPWTSLPMPPFAATKGGAPWAGVRCSVGGDVLRVRVDDDAAGGSGHCAIDTSGGPFTVDLSVIR